ncbi:MAG: FAD-dependent oxidoreductase [Chloroflexi bacterium]|nr:FAD-dependent oxidoreductase [Chloroflexota bacterium]
MPDKTYDVLIAGQGVAAFSAALYAARYRIDTVVVGEKFGGETATGGLIENYPGIYEIEGLDLMIKMKEQTEKYGVPIVDAKVIRIEREGECFRCSTEEQSYRAASVILAVGRERRKLGLDHEDEWTGRGVSYCSVCDAPLNRNKVTAVVGGGDAAIKGAVLLSQYAKKVYVIYRGPRFTRPEPANLRHLEERGNVEMLFNTNVVRLLGSDGLTGIELDRPVHGAKELALDSIFVEIGADPNASLAEQLGVSLTSEHEIDVDKMMRTNIEGVFAAGDVTNASGHLKQAITAAAQGALAATSAYAYISTHGNACERHAMGFALEKAA